MNNIEANGHKIRLINPKVEYQIDCTNSINTIILSRIDNKTIDKQNVLEFIETNFDTIARVCLKEDSDSFYEYTAKLSKNKKNMYVSAFKETEENKRLIKTLFNNR